MAFAFQFLLGNRSIAVGISVGINLTGTNDKSGVFKEHKFLGA
ncbi:MULTISPECIES: hypothetical protein [Cyanophyceae]|nr:hypothetical protein [Phormidium sp. FACHB-592]